MNKSLRQSLWIGVLALNLTGCLKAGTWVPTEGGNNTISESASETDLTTDSTSQTESATLTDTSTTSDTDSSSSPRCGNGKIELGEECDDGDMEANGAPDGCNSSCVRDRIVFVTSATYSGALGGVTGADAKCQSTAEKAALNGNFMAWLSDGASSPLERFTTQSAGRYVLANKTTLIATNWASLIAPPLASPINMTETKKILTENEEKRVWTSTNIDGTAADGAHCLTWTDNVEELGLSGNAGKTDNSWTVEQLASCNLNLRLYCFEQ